MTGSDLTVRDVMSPGVPPVVAEGNLLDAAKRLHGFGIPALPVVDAGGRCLGVLTAWDVVRAIAMESDLGSTSAAELVSHHEPLSPDQRLEVAARRGGPLTPVVENGLYVGVLTRADVAAAERAAKLLGPSAAAIRWEISPNDTMHSGIRGSYLMAGLYALEWIRTGMETAGEERLDVIVDLPCGHGRVLRVLRAAFPQAKLVACDLDREGVDFCASTFGAEPVYSDSEPANIRIGRVADLVWVGSLLTHLPPARWPGFLDLFERTLRPGGLLVVTTFDRPREMFLRSMAVGDPEAMLRARDDEGFSFRPYEGEPGYGLMLAAPEWVRDRFAETSFEVVRHAPRGWFPPGPAQDVWICRAAGS